MQILMISPHPVYSPRGTPISVFNRCVALCSLGHQVDLVTYPIGRDVAVDGLRYIRPTVPGIKAVAIGPSWAKIPLNAAVSARALSTLIRSRGRYDAIHSHEEAGPVGTVAARISGLPHVYDMGNDWGVVLQNYGVASDSHLVGWASAAEAQVVRRAAVTIAHFPAIRDSLARRNPASVVKVIHNITLEPEPHPSVVAALRAHWWSDGRPLVVYAGTLERYQGVVSLIEAMALAADCAARLVIIGGHQRQIVDLQAEATRHGVSDRVSFTGVLDPSLIPAFLAAADVLVSPRSSGSNTPLKIFSYLRSGTPIVATAIESHTQILDDRSSLLVAPTAQGLAAGLRAVLSDVVLAERLAAGGRAAGAPYTIEAYVHAVADAYHRVGAPAPEPAMVKAAAAEVRRTTEGHRTTAATAGALTPINVLASRHTPFSTVRPD
jgi:glycosyltransferase involved in cell wall biosynthesis